MATEMSLTQRVMATAGLMLATLTYTLDTTIANIALPHMQGSIAASSDQMVWVLTSYMVASAIMIPLSGWLSLRIGRRRLFQLSTFSFMVASMLCGAATSLPQIVIFRVFQGLAGASLMPLSQALILDQWPPRRIPTLMSVWSAVATAAPIIGPTLGGYLTDTLSWRWAFYINVPLDIVSLIIVQTFLPRDEGGQQRSFDLLGFIGIAMFSVGIQLMMDRGQTKDWFDSTEVLVEATAAALGLYLFLVQMFTARVPFFQRELFRDRNFNYSIVMTLLLGSTLFASSAFLPVMMQQLFGFSATHAGYLSMPRGYGSLLAFLFSPFLIARIGARSTMICGIMVTSVALWQMGHFDLVMDESKIQLAGFLQGVGSGLAFNPMSVLSFATLEGQRRTEASVVGNMMRSISGSIGIAFYATLQLRQSITLRGHLVSHVVPGDLLTDIRLPDLSADNGLAGLSAEVNRQAAMIGYNTAFGMMCMSTLVMLPMVLMMKPSTPGDKIDPAAAAAH